jgi:hypothetical protein
MHVWPQIALFNFHSRGMKRADLSGFVIRWSLKFKSLCRRTSWVDNLFKIMVVNTIGLHICEKHVPECVPASKF